MVFVDLNREKTRMMGVNLADAFEPMQAYFGALYVNDFNRFGRIWRVQLQAEPNVRSTPTDIERIYYLQSAWSIACKERMLVSSTKTLTRIVRVTNENGMHMTPCMHMTELVKNFEGSVHLSNGKDVADCHSIIDLMLLNAVSGTALCLTVTGDEAERITEQIVQFFHEKFHREM